MTIEDFRNEFKDYFSEDEINILMEALRYIYIAQGGHEGGVLVEDANAEYNKELVLTLAQPGFEYITQSSFSDAVPTILKHYGASSLQVYNCSDKGGLVAQELVGEILTRNKDELINFLEGLPRLKIINWYFAGKASSKGYRCDFYQEWALCEDLWKGLTEFNLTAVIRNYDRNSRGDKIKDQQKIYVIPPEVWTIIEDFIKKNCTPDIRHYKIIGVLKEYQKGGTTLPLSKLQETLEGHGLTFEDIQGVLSYLGSKEIIRISSAFKEDKPPFLILKSKEYQEALASLHLDDSAKRDLDEFLGSQLPNNLSTKNPPKELHTDINVFISYSGEDSKRLQVPQIAEALKEKSPKLKVHYFEDPHEPISDFNEFMEIYIQKSDIFIPICTKNYIAQESRCRHELAMAMDQKKYEKTIPLFEGNHALIPRQIHYRRGVDITNKTAKTIANEIYSRILDSVSINGGISDSL